MFRAPDKAAESIGVTTWSLADRTVVHSGPAGVQLINSLDLAGLIVLGVKV